MKAAKSIISIFYFVTLSSILFAQSKNSESKFGIPETASCSRSATVSIELGKVTHKMAGGIGASWHAICKDLPGHRGSAWGANFPLANETAWQQIYQHASWLGMNWLRVELSQRMYEPEREVFDWENDEMKTLYRILDWCQENNVDVFLTQMWSNVQWNAFAGVEPLRSAPRSIDDFAKGLAIFIDYLINTKKYTCIRWLCITNEPWFWWRGPDNSKRMSITPALKAIRSELDQRNIGISLSAPDWYSIDILEKKPPFQPIDFDAYIGAYDAHSYWGIGENNLHILAKWVDMAHERKKPFFLSEMGDFNLGWKGSHPGPKSYKAAISNTQTVIKGLNVGVDAFNRWSFLNRGDLDGQWQLVRSWDMETKKFLTEASPEHVSYFGFGILTRFIAKYSEILECQINETDSNEVGSQLLVAALRSPVNKNLTVILLNTDPQVKFEAGFKLKGLENPLRFHRYRVTETEINKADFKLEPQTDFFIIPASAQFSDEILPFSITVYSTFKLKHCDTGITID
ncbi:MAG: hypothetical protein ACYSSI_06275 [Planctomycetota bacterium]